MKNEYDELIKIILKENEDIEDNCINLNNDMKVLIQKNLLTIYQGDLSNYTMNITFDFKNYKKYKIPFKEEYILIFYVADVYVSNEYRNKKYSFYLFYNLCIYLFYNLCIYLLNKFNNKYIFLCLDDCTGYDYKNNIYSKMNFYVEQGDELVNIYNWKKDMYNNNPSEIRYGYLPIILNKCKNILSNTI